MGAMSESGVGSCTSVLLSRVPLCRGERGSSEEEQDKVFRSQGSERQSCVEAADRSGLLGIATAQHQTLFKCVCVQVSECKRPACFCSGLPGPASLWHCQDAFVSLVATAFNSESLFEV